LYIGVAKIIGNVRRKLGIMLIEQSADNNLDPFFYISWEHQLIFMFQQQNSFPEDWITDLEYSPLHPMIIE